MTLVRLAVGRAAGFCIFRRYCLPLAMTPKERAELENILNIYRRQKAKTESSIEEYKAQIEELQIQSEQYPGNEEVQQELSGTKETLRKIQESYELVQSKISGIEWLLD